MRRVETVPCTYPCRQEPAVKGISLHAAPGELVLVTGASGCGKSTLLRLADGLCPCHFGGRLEGRILIDGKDACRMGLGEISNLVGTLFQDPEQQFFALGVEDELAFAHEWHGTTAMETGRRICRAAEELGITHILGQSIHALSEGQRQGVGRAAMFSRRPKALGLDEPTANRDPEATAELGRRLERLKRLGLAILVVDHRLYWLENAADRVVVMNGGSFAASGPFSILMDAALRDACGLRSPHVEDLRTALPEKAAPSQEARHGEQGIRLSGLTFSYGKNPPLYENTSLWIGRGVTALIGGNGAGKTTLARILTGLSRVRSGVIHIDGAEIPQSRMLRHAGIVLQNSDHQLHMKSVMQEIEVCIALANRAAGRKAGGSEVRSESLRLLEMFGLVPLAERHPQSLSGGEKQRLVIACAFAKKPSVLILDEPTSGLDGANMRRIGHALELLASEGVSILVITHDLELLQMSCTAAIRLPLQTRSSAMRTDTGESNA
ncbi:MAG: ABC transporter ATP-binding protein [Mailhella sp.]|nr:ABC transporter ATP-binding protein [Mailhella sp.]